MQTSVYVPDWLMKRLPTMPRGFLSVLLQERLLDVLPATKADDREKIEEQLIRLKAQAMIGTLR